MSQTTPKSKTKTPTSSATSKAFTAEERAAMKARAQELKAEARANKSRAEGEADLLAKVDELPEPERALALRLHALIQAAAPSLSPKTWYGMPAYTKDEKVLCFFQSAQKFNTRYATLGFSDLARLDDGDMWPTAFALRSLSPKEEATIRALILRAVG
jgi:uncharacterized protein YdhG (YjbR/CyaY superfamily)